MDTHPASAEPFCHTSPATAAESPHPPPCFAGLFKWWKLFQLKARIAAITTAGKINTRWKSTQPLAEGDIDHANITEKLAGPMKRPRLSAVLNMPLSLPRCCCGTTDVDATVNMSMTFGETRDERHGGRKSFHVKHYFARGSSVCLFSPVNRSRSRNPKLTACPPFSSSPGPCI